jgi:uncharacterized protein (TIGR00251 family)
MVGGEHDGALRVSVSAPADKGRANAAIIKALAKAFGLRASQIELVRGAASRRKVFAIEGQTENLQRQLGDLKKAEIRPPSK